jgi:CDP-diacylglycerol---glycerol-3-phosphate 3-phosphatidyltransferase
MIDGRRRRGAATPHQPTEGVPSRTQRVGRRLVDLGITANAVTFTGVVLAALTGLVVGLGHLIIGVVLLTIGGLMDALDGIVAKAAGSASPRGAFLDSVADRLSDALIFGGVTWHLLEGHDPKLAILPVAILAVSSLISYERAKAESLGFSARGGLMERAERLILLGVALFFHVVLVPLLICLLVLSTATATGRFVRVWRAASGIPARHDLVGARVESQWRAWRESGRARTRRRARNRRELEPVGTRLRKVLAANRPVPRSRRHNAGRRRAMAAFRARIDGSR